ncbi:hypothetical protein PM082_020798 [Marasmius tenuissimus]|nr:hypothetical protein PM082_020798 [Marasmius tenuissimus]
MGDVTVSVVSGSGQLPTPPPTATATTTEDKTHHDMLGRVEKQRNDDIRARTLNALQAYITTQRALLSQTRGDIERLRELRTQVVACPSAVVDKLKEEGRGLGENSTDAQGGNSQDVEMDVKSASGETSRDTGITQHEVHDMDLGFDGPEFSLSTRVRECFHDGEGKDRVFPWAWDGFERSGNSGCDPTLLHQFKAESAQQIQQINSTSLACLPPLPPSAPLTTATDTSAPLQTVKASTATSSLTTSSFTVTPKTVTKPSAPLTTYIANARSTIIDPVFEKYGLSYNPEPLPVEEKKETPKEKEHKKIRELKKRKINGCAGLRVGAARNSGDGVHVRKDTGDESMDVDVSVDGAGTGGAAGPPPQKAKPKPKPKAPPRSLIPPPLPMVLTKSPRVRRPSVKASLHEQALDREREREREREKSLPTIKLTVRPPPIPTLGPAKPKGPTIVIPALWHPRRMGGAHVRACSTATATTATTSMTGVDFMDEEDDSDSGDVRDSEVDEEAGTQALDDEDPEPPPMDEGMDDMDMDMTVDDVNQENEDAETYSSQGRRHTKPSKSRPETYKQPWSTQEQHLLERLLEEIPEGANQRWKQISQKMGGRRTPRQVASRVQKWVEKLRKYDLA